MRPALLLVLSLAAASIRGGSSTPCGPPTGDAPCPPDTCCSQYDICGYQDGGPNDPWCGTGCQYGNCYDSPTTTPPPTPPPPSPTGEPCSAGPPIVAGPCADPTHCCSIHGYCEYGADYCAPGNCADGPCWDSPTGPGPTTTPPPTPPPTPPTQSSTCSNDPLTFGPCADPTHCCSQWGFCDTTYQHCSPDENCKYNCWSSPTGPTTAPVPTKAPTPFPTFSPATTFNTEVDDSRLIAYMGNWQACPTDEQVAQYTHIVIAFAVTYNNQCSLASSVDVCGNAVNQAKVDAWRSAGKKVILSFGGANMGGSWGGEANSWWDHCFGKEATLAQGLVDLVQSQNFDGVDLDYEYCYDIASGRHGRNCVTQNGSGKYSSVDQFDADAQNFLAQMTIQLRTRLDDLSLTTGQHYELTQAPMDSDLDRNRGFGESPYYTILKTYNYMLDFLMPQFYNGGKDAVNQGFVGSGVSGIYTDIATDLFPNRPDKVVFGFCITGCTPTATGSQAVSVLQQVKAYDQQQYACNGGAFFWVALHDTSPGDWSDPVWAEVSLTQGCSAGGTPAPSTSPTKSPTSGPSKSPTASPMEQFPGMCSDNTNTCAEGDTSTCTCHAGRRLLRQGKIDDVRPPAKEGKLLRSVLKGTARSNIQIERELKGPPPKDPTPTTADPTSSPTHQPTSPPTGLQTPGPTSSPSTPPTGNPTGASVCECIMPTPNTPGPTAPPTSSPTSPPTKPPTPPPVGDCDCTQFTQMNLCKDGCDAIRGTADDCKWSGSGKSCGPP